MRPFPMGTRIEHNRSAKSQPRDEGENGEDCNHAGAGDVYATAQAAIVLTGKSYVDLLGK
mgnify:CR=1 FL=1